MSNPFNEIDRGQYLIENSGEIANRVKEKRQMNDSEQWAEEDVETFINDLQETAENFQDCADAINNMSRAEYIRANSRQLAKKYLEEADRQRNNNTCEGIVE